MTFLDRELLLIPFNSSIALVSFFFATTLTVDRPREFLLPDSVITYLTGYCIVFRANSSFANDNAPNRYEPATICFGNL